MRVRVSGLMGRLALSACLLGMVAWGRSSGAPARESGVPNEGVCTDCHDGVVNSGSGSLKVTLLDAAGWVPGQQYRLRITLTDPDAKRWGFQITPRLASDTSKAAGSLAVAEPQRTQLQSTGGVESITHTAAGTGQGTTGSSTWEILWKAPADSSAGDVQFYVSGNAANNSGSPDGDRIYAASVTLKPVSAPAVTRKYVPAFVVGGGWSTAIYGYNLTGQSLPIKIRLYGDDGSPLQGLPASTIESNVEPRGGGSIDAEPLSGGPSTSGYAAIDLPDGLNVYTVLRAPLADGAVTEASFMASTAVAAATIPWNDTKRETQVSLVNPGSDPLKLNLALRNESGSVMGRSSLTVAPGARLVFKIFEVPEFSSIPRDQSGTLDIDAAPGVFAAAAFSIGPKSLAAAPVSERPAQ